MTRDRVQVVTAFIVHKGKVFLIKRSERVGTYCGSWAAVSGYVEELPIAQARTEVLEETGLGPDEVRLRGIGRPLPVDDPADGRRWLVFPFLFETDHPERVRTDWEAAESAWVDPSDIERLKTVPGLLEVFRTVWPPFGKAEFWLEMEQIACDTKLGATDLATIGLLSLAAHVERDDVERAALAYAACRPSMGLFPHLAARFITDLTPGSDHRALARELASELAAATDESAMRTAERLSSARRVLTHSRSRAVEEAILAWAGKRADAEVVITESRPGLEGVGLARDLSKHGSHVTLITDAQVSHFVPICDAVVVGCDAITPSDMLVNKTGTRLAVLAARAAGVPAYAVTQTFKIMPSGWPEVTEEQDPNQVHPAEDFRVRNIIFDRTPISEFTAVVTEQGKLNEAMLSRYRELQLP